MIFVNVLLVNFPKHILICCGAFTGCAASFLASLLFDKSADHTWSFFSNCCSEFVLYLFSCLA